MAVAKEWVWLLLQPAAVEVRVIEHVAVCPSVLRTDLQHRCRDKRMWQIWIQVVWLGNAGWLWVGNVGWHIWQCARGNVDRSHGPWLHFIFYALEWIQCDVTVRWLWLMTLGSFRSKIQWKTVLVNLHLKTCWSSSPTKATYKGSICHSKFTEGDWMRLNDCDFSHQNTLSQVIQLHSKFELNFMCSVQLHHEKKTISATTSMTVIWLFHCHFVLPLMNLSH